MREGLTRQDYTLPNSFLGKSSPQNEGKKGPLTGAELELMKDDYYAHRGWEVKTGIPSRATLERFGLNEIADDLERRGRFSACDS